jgi:hypothetical protein
MSITLIKSAINDQVVQWPSQMSIDAWIADQQIRADQVALYRRYADGDHDGDLTSDMRSLLRVGTRPETTAPFNLNRMDNVIQTVNDRLEVTAIEDANEDKQAPAANATEPAALATPETVPALPRPEPSPMTALAKPDIDPVADWIEDIQQFSRFDAMQQEVHEGALRDRVSYVFANWNADAGKVEFIHEPAYDGTSGMLVLWQRRMRSEMMAAVKVWQITSETGNIADTMRVNVYYPNRIEKFIAVSNATALMPYYEDDDPATVFEDDSGRQFIPWTLNGSPDGESIGVPVVPFINRPQPYTNDGRSEIEDLIPIQDAANRLMYSMVLAAELTAFQNRVARGFSPPSGLTPGAWIAISPEQPLDKEKIADVDVLPAGQVTPYIEALHFCIQQIDQISRTPNPETMGSSASSGEALKQREIGLLGKVKRAQIGFGNAWEDCFKLAARVQQAFGSAPPVFEQLRAVWRDPEIRNRSNQVENILKLEKIMGREWAARQVGKIYDMSDAEIQAVLDEQQAAQARNIQTLMQESFNGFGRGQPLQNGNRPQPMQGNPMANNLMQGAR